MSAIPTRRRRAAGALVAGVLSLAVLAGCTTTQKDASNYADTEDDFVAGCIEQAELDNEVAGASRISAPDEYCQCVFDAVSEEIEFERFKEINSELRDEGGALPDDLVEIYATCDASEG